MTRFQIRAAEIEDAAGLASVHVRSWQSAYVGMVPQEHLDALSVEKRAEGWRNGLSSGAFRTFVATNEDGIVGLVSVGATRDEGDSPGAFEVGAIYISPGLWRQGIGRALWLRASEEAQMQGALTLSAWVFERNDDSRTFYEAVGCVHSGAQKTMEIGGEKLIAVRYTLGL